MFLKTKVVQSREEKALDFWNKFFKIETRRDSDTGNHHWSFLPTEALSSPSLWIHFLSEKTLVFQHFFLASFRHLESSCPSSGRAVTCHVSYSESLTIIQLLEPSHCPRFTAFPRMSVQPNPQVFPRNAWVALHLPQPRLSSCGSCRMEKSPQMIVSLYLPERKELGCLSFKCL